MLSNSKSKFSKAPLTAQEKERKAEEFLNNINYRKEITNNDEKNNIKLRVTKKEKVIPKLLRFPYSLSEDIQEISNITGLSINAVCIELLRPGVKNKLKELKE